MFWTTNRKLKELNQISREIQASLRELISSTRDLPKRESEKPEAETKISPLVTLILGGIGTALLAVTNNFFQWYSSHTLEQDKLRSTLILRASPQG